MILDLQLRPDSLFIFSKLYLCLLSLVSFFLLYFACGDEKNCIKWCSNKQLKKPDAFMHLIRWETYRETRVLELWGITIPLPTCNDSKIQCVNPLNPQLFSDIYVCKHELMDSVKSYFPTKVSLTEEVKLQLFKWADMVTKSLGQKWLSLIIDNTHGNDHLQISGSATHFHF